MVMRNIVGRGTLWNADGNPGEFSSFGEISIAWDSQSVELPDTSVLSANSYDFYLGKKGTLTFSCNTIDATTWALLTGGTETVNLSRHFEESEPVTVPANPGPYTVVLDNTPIAENDAATIVGVMVYTKDSSGNIATKLSQVAAGAEVAGESYSVVAATGTLTFAAGDADVVYYANYWYTGTAGARVRVGSNDFPSTFEFWGFLDAPAKNGYVQMPVVIPDISPSMPDGWGASRLAAGGPFTITAGITGDNIDFYFNTA